MLEVAALVVQRWVRAAIIQHVAKPDEGDLEAITESELSAFTLYEDAEPELASDTKNAPDGTKVAPKGSTPLDVLTTGFVREPSPATERTSILLV